MRLTISKITECFLAFKVWTRKWNLSGRFVIQIIRFDSAKGLWGGKKGKKKISKWQYEQGGQSIIYRLHHYYVDSQIKRRNEGWISGAFFFLVSADGKGKPKQKRAACDWLNDTWTNRKRWPPTLMVKALLADFITGPSRLKSLSWLDGWLRSRFWLHAN